MQNQPQIFHTYYSEFQIRSKEMIERPDYVQLRSDITTEDAVEEQVQVNQRNLIDKILARSVIFAVVILMAIRG